MIRRSPESHPKADHNGRDLPAQPTNNLTAAAPSHPSQPLLTVGAYVVLAVGIPAVVCAAILAETASPDWSDAAFVYLAVFIYCGARLARLSTCREANYVALTFFIFGYVWMGMAALAQTLAQTWPFIRPSAGAQLAASAIILLGIIAYDLGRYCTRLIANRHLGKGLEGPEEPDRRRVLAARRVVFFAWIALLASPLLIVRLGGPSVLFSNRQAAADVIFPSGVENGVAANQTEILLGTLIRDGATTLVFVLFYCLVLLWRGRRTTPLPSRVVFMPPLFGLLVVNLLVNNPLSSARFWFGTVLIAVALTFPLFARLSGRLIFTASALVVASLLFTYGNYFRYAPGLSSPAQPGAIQAFETEGDYDASAEVAATVEYVQAAGYSNGRQLLGVVGFFVPRRVWPDKPLDTGYVLGYAYGTATPNLSAPLWAEGYINFGWLGSSLFLFMFGAISSWLDRQWNAGPRFATFGKAFVPLFAGYSIILLRGSLLQSMDRLTVLTLALWLLMHQARSHAGEAYHAPRISTRPFIRDRSTELTNVGGPAAG